MSKVIYQFLLEKIGNPVGVCALMGNLYVESKLNPKLLEGSYARKFGMTGEEYTQIFDRITSSEIDTFVHDGAGYGLAQWTYWSRKKGLWEYAQKRNRSVGDLDTQLEYLWNEIQSYKTVITVLRGATSLREASDIVCLRYEKPEHTEEKYLQNRANYGEKFYEEYVIKMEEKEAKKAMNSAAYVDQKIAEIKMNGKPVSDQAWEAALLCVGWPYIFGDRGEYCTPAKRQAVHNSHPSQEGLISKCQVLNGSKNSCTGCKWLPGGNKVRSFDCRGFTYWVLLQFGIKIMGTGATAQWNDESNWEAKGTIDTIPEDKLVCLFYPEKTTPKKMAHTGFGYKGETVECSNGVQHFTKRNKKWSHWALPKGFSSSPAIIPPQDTEVKLPTLRKGDKGSYVVILQTMLLNRGYQLPKYGADGSFGNETLAAVEQFQKDFGLKVDGVVGEATWKMLENSSEPKKTYTVTIPNLSEEMANDLLSKYAGTKTAEQ